MENSKTPLNQVLKELALVIKGCLFANQGAALLSVATYLYIMPRYPILEISTLAESLLPPRIFEAEPPLQRKNIPCKYTPYNCITKTFVSPALA